MARTTKTGPAVTDETQSGSGNTAEAVSTEAAAELQSATEDVAMATPFQITLDEFCIKLSLRGESPEAIGGFRYTMKVQKRVKDYESNWNSLFIEFMNTPVVD